MIFISSKVSDGNMTFSREDSKKVLENRKKFFKRFGINHKKIAEVKQVHGNKIVIVNKISTKIAEADGLITNNPEIFLMVKAADCHQIGIYDPIHTAIALIHAGYKGLGKRIIKKAIDDLKKNFKSNPKDLIVQFGPAIGPCHYRMDLWTETENQLISLGVLKKNIYNLKICTYESKDYFSHRRSEDTNTPDYRFVTILGLKNVN